MLLNFKAKSGKDGLLGKSLFKPMALDLSLRSESRTEAEWSSNISTGKVCGQLHGELKFAKKVRKCCTKHVCQHELNFRIFISKPKSTISKKGHKTIYIFSTRNSIEDSQLASSLREMEQRSFCSWFLQKNHMEEPKEVWKLISQPIYLAAVNPRIAWMDDVWILDSKYLSAIRDELCSVFIIFRLLLFPQQWYRYWNL